VGITEDLLRTSPHRFEWTDKCQKAFEAMKLRLMSGPILALQIDSGTYIGMFDADASDFGLGAIWSHEQFGTERVIACSSQTLSKAEQRYETTRKELLAIVSELKQSRQYLVSASSLSILINDHATLSRLCKTPESTPQLARWLTYIQEFDYTVLHRPDRKHSNVDGLSKGGFRIESDEEDTPDCSAEPTNSSIQTFKLFKSAFAYVVVRCVTLLRHMLMLGR